MDRPQANLLSDGRRLHLNHGPIDLIIEAFGEAQEVRQAYDQAVARFQTVLGELVGELAELRKPASLYRRSAFFGSTARRMEAAVAPLARDFITPMAAVAGAVADEMMAAMIEGRELDKAYVNNGGDIALHISPGQSLTLAVGGTGHGFADRITIDAEAGVRGVATSGWRGRSFSLGIADAVTVLARTTVEADAAATIIANAVDLPGHPAVERQPACKLSPDSDLGDRWVTTAVGGLTASEIDTALRSGCHVGDELIRRGLIVGSALFLAGASRVVGNSLSSVIDRAKPHGAFPLHPRTLNSNGSMHA